MQQSWPSREHINGQQQNDIGKLFYMKIFSLLFIIYSVVVNIFRREPPNNGFHLALKRRLQLWSCRQIRHEKPRRYGRTGIFYESLIVFIVWFGNKSSVSWKWQMTPPRERLAKISAKLKDLQLFSVLLKFKLGREAVKKNVCFF